jgi:hypothetical protein
LHFDRPVFVPFLLLGFFAVVRSGLSVAASRGEVARLVRERRMAPVTNE